MVAARYGLYYKPERELRHGVMVAVTVIVVLRRNVDIDEVLMMEKFRLKLAEIEHLYQASRTLKY